MLNLRGDQVCGFVRVEKSLKHAGEREVVGLGAAGGEDDFLVRGV